MTPSKYIVWFVAALLFALAVNAPAETVALALSGGGARGFASIGILQALEEERLEPDLIVGTSIGAVLGGLYAAGYSTGELEQLAVGTDWTNIFLDRPARRNLFLGQKETVSRHILSLRFRGWSPELPVALTTGQKLSEFLFDLVHRAPYHAWDSFDDLRIPFRAVATDLISGKPIIFSSGDMAEAMRASISLPLVFTPYRLDSMVLVDGGVVENIPVDIAKQQGADVVVAVDMSAGLEADENLSLPWELAGRVTTIMHSQRNGDSRTAADIVITPNVGMHKVTDFTAVAELIRAGYEAAQAKMPELRAKMHRSDSSRVHHSSTFCSRNLYQNFRRDLAAAGSTEHFVFHGVRHIPDSTLRSIPPGRDGARKLELLRRTYMDDGYCMAHATALAVSPGNTISSTWDEGRIRSIRVAGLRRHGKGSVLRDFPLEVGELFDLRRARRGLSQIYGSDLFESATMAVQPSDSGVNLVLRVEERQSPQLRLGAGFSLERKGRGFVEFLNDNALDLGARLSLFGKYGERDEELRAALVFDRMPFSTPIDHALQGSLTTDVRGGWRREEYSFYDAGHESIGSYFIERLGAEAWAGRSFRRWGELSLGLRHQRIRVGGVTIEPVTHLTSFAVRSIIDTKDRYPFPNSGVSFNGEYRYSLQSKVTGRAFNRATASAEAYLPLTHRLVLHGGGDYAWNDRILPLWGQYPLGGENSLLGLHVAERLGNSKLSFLAEVRYDLISRWLADAYLSALYTAGAVTSQSASVPSSKYFQHGIGASFGLSTLLGPMKLTAGQLMDTRLAKRQTRIYLELGHEF